MNLKKAVKRISQKLGLFSGVYLVQILLFISLYYLSARIGLSLNSVNRFATLIWAPTGIALASLILYGYRLWPAVFIGAFLANYHHGADPLLAAGIATGNTLEALLGAYLLSKVRFKSGFESLHDTLQLIFLAALLSTLVSAIIGSSSLFAAGIINEKSFRITFSTWWVGDVLGNLVVAPLILLWINKIRLLVQLRNFKIRVAYLIELFIVYFALIVLATLAFGPPNTGFFPIGYIAMPPLIWLAVRFGPIEAMTGIFILSVISIWGTIGGYGEFVKRNLSESLFLLQGFIGMYSMVTLALSSTIQESILLNQERNTFINIISHELRSPITVLKGYTQTMSVFPKLNPKVKSYALSMEREIDKLIKLIGDLLDFSRLGNTSFGFEYTEFDMSELIEDIVKNSMVANYHRRIIFKNHQPVLVRADKYRISQVVSNLLTNAMKFSPKSKPIIVKLARNRKNVTVSIKDNGIGIPVDRQRLIFERFYRVDEHHQGGGLGLGLYISAQIIKGHQGKIGVENRYGKGSTFFFTLPLVKRAKNLTAEV